MIYLIGQMSAWLLLTAALAAFAGWSFAAWRAAPEQRALRRERDRLVRELGGLAAGEETGSSLEIARAAEANASLSHIRDGRIAELERALETARARAEDAVAEAAELRRNRETALADNEELTRLRAFAADQEERSAREVQVEAEPAPTVDDEIALQAWRLRYFEQRVRYLESRPAPTPPQLPPPAPEPDPDPLPEWRAREAEARAAHLEAELRALTSAPEPEPAVEEEAAPFAANADVDVLLRWRLLYLERRVAHLQAMAAEKPAEVAPPAPVEVTEAAPDPDRWKWRARYLEARVRHLEQRPAPQAPAMAPAPQAAAAEPAPAPQPTTRRAKPAVFTSARNGAPDDLTLIEGVSLLQQTTLNSIGIFHFDQIAAWTPDNVAWVDQYLRLRGRIEEEEWVEQAIDLAREGPAAARRISESEEA